MPSGPHGALLERLRAFLAIPEAIYARLGALAGRLGRSRTVPGGPRGPPGRFGRSRGRPAPPMEITGSAPGRPRALLRYIYIYIYIYIHIHIYIYMCVALLTVTHAPQYPPLPPPPTPTPGSLGFL